jgi:hypothetical protein
LRVEECIAKLESAQNYPSLVRDMRNDASSMQEILADPQDPTRSKFCVEFLNDTYLKNTEKLQAFVTFSKDGIDKGIRCMVSFMRSDDIQAQLDAI